MNYVCFRYVLILFYSSIFLIGCSNFKKEDNNRGKDNSTSSMYDIDNLEIDTLLLKRDTVSMKTHRLFPVHEYVFDYTHPQFPSIRKEYVAMISGFVTDGKGHFYIAGGSPIRLVCYDGTKKEYDIELSEAISNYAIMKLYGDSIIFVEESAKSLAKVCKDGSGKVKHYQLPLETQDSIIGGRFNNDNIELTIFDTSVKCTSHEDYKRNISSCLISLSTLCFVTDSLDNGEQKWFLTDSARNIIGSYNYFGKYNSINIYYSYNEESLSLGSVALVDEHGNLLINSSLQNLPKTPTFCGSEEHEGEFYTENMFHLYNYHFFLSGYDSDSGTMTILDYDISPLYKIAKRKMINE